MFGLDAFSLLNGCAAAATEPAKLFGLAAIAHYNGWAMTATGATIVFTGLAVLSFTISQLHKLIALLDPSTTVAKKLDPEPEKKQKITINPLDPEHISNLYLPIIEKLDSEFQIADLHALAREHQLPYPHLSIRCLREAGKLEFLGEGFCRYKG